MRKKHELQTFFPFLRICIIKEQTIAPDLLLPYFGEPVPNLFREVGEVKLLAAT